MMMMLAKIVATLPTVGTIFSDLAVICQPVLAEFHRKSRNTQ